MYINTYYFFFNHTATTEIYTLSLHDALPISGAEGHLAFLHMEARIGKQVMVSGMVVVQMRQHHVFHVQERSEEHTSELQSRPHLVCRLLLEKKKIIILTYNFC